MASEHWPTYVILVIYLVLTAVVTFAAKKKNSDPNDESSQVTKHFLGSKNFGPVLLVLTTFASVFSGYTVVGVPTEAGKFGFTAIRWMGVGSNVSMLIIYPRLRRLSIVRDYESPGDFIHDRYRSRALSILVAMLLCLPQIPYIGINLFSLGSTLEALTDGELDFYWIVVMSTIIILVFEALGGMRSVAYTDAVEAVVMICIFLTVPVMIGVYYGGFVGQVNDSNDLTVPCDNSYANDTNGCLNYAVYELPEPIDNETDSSSDGEISEYFLRSPSSITILNHVLFCCGGLSFALNPHVCQRALTAKADSHLRFVIGILFLTTFMCQIPGILTGITHISNQWEGDAFSAMLANFEDRGGFSALVSYIALLAGITGIMSTADSALIGVSNTLSVDIFRNHVFTDFTPTQIVYVGKAVSLVTMSLCLAFACWLYNTDEDYGSVYTVQQGLLWQAVPAYIFGLYTNLSARAVLTGTSVGLTTCIILISVLFSNGGAHDPFPFVDKAWSTLTGVALNMSASWIAHHFIFAEDADDTDFDDEDLSIIKIRKIMSGISEPMTKWRGLLVVLTFIPSLLIVVHWIDDIDPELVEEYGFEEVDKLMYNGRVREVIGGLPDYFFQSLLWLSVAAVTGIVATLQWDVDVDDTRKDTTDSQHVASDSVDQGTCTGTLTAGKEVSKDSMTPSGFGTEMLQLNDSVDAGHSTAL